jgi:hypothetical protein
VILATRRHASIFACLLAFLATMTTAGSREHWLHVTVDGEQTVRISVPLSTVDALKTGIPGLRVDADDVRGAGRFDANRLRSIWLSLRDHEGDLVTIDSDDEHVTVKKTRSQLVVLADDGDDGRVEIRVPVKVMDALFPDESTVDISGALAALAEEGSGELVRITSASQRIRVWVDAKP